MRSHLFSETTTEPTENWGIHRGKMLRVVIDGATPVYAAKGSMVAYQGQLQFDHHSGGGGMKGMMKRAVSSDNTPLMKISGQAEVFLANLAYDVHLIQLENDSVSVNGRSLLAFEHTYPVQEW